MTRTIRIAKGSSARSRSPFAPVESAIAAFRAGQMVIVVDDEDRENEGDLTMAAEMVTPEAINFMATYGRGPGTSSRFGRARASSRGRSSRARKSP